MGMMKDDIAYQAVDFMALLNDAWKKFAALMYLRSTGLSAAVVLLYDLRTRRRAMKFTCLSQRSSTPWQEQASRSCKNVTLHSFCRCAT